MLRPKINVGFVNTDWPSSTSPLVPLSVMTAAVKATLVTAAAICAAVWATPLGESLSRA